MLRPASTSQFRPSARFVCCALAAILLSGLYASGDRAAGGDDDGTAVASLAVVVPDPTLDPRILTLELGGAGWHAAVRDLDAALFAQADARRRLDGATAELLARHGELNSTEAQLEATRTVEATIDDEIDDLEEIIRAWAVSRFVSFGEDEADLIASAGASVEASRGVQLAHEVDLAHVQRRELLLSRRVTVDIQERALFAQVESVQRVITALGNDITTAREDLRRAEAAIEQSADDVAAARWKADVAGTDLSVVALDAYLAADTKLAESHPECGLRWWMLAGVGRIESRHGEIGGRWVRADGRTSSPIIGIPLDGGPGVRAIVDTDGGTYDGDAIWDRAVGPMQFIPETWTRRAVDGSGDGVADPHNLYDAALTTGRYLCRLGEDLSHEQGRHDAYFGYNTSNKYVEDVDRHALRYAELSLGHTEPVQSSVDNG